MRIKQTIQTIAIVIPVVGGIYAGADYLGLRPPFMFEFAALAEDVHANSEKHIRRDLRDLTAERAKLELLRLDFMETGKPVPGWLRDRLVDIEVDERELDDRLQLLLKGENQ
jgi:hypothetical protein